MIEGDRIPSFYQRSVGTRMEPPEIKVFSTSGTQVRQIIMFRNPSAAEV
jgi:hypothetical protein